MAIREDPLDPRCHFKLLLSYTNFVSSLMPQSKALRFLKQFAIIILLTITVIAIGIWLLPKGPVDQLSFDDPWGQEREMVVAKTHGVVAGTPWASEAAMAALNKGGNAYDAAIAGLCMLYVTHGEASAFPGIAPIMVYHAETDTIRGYVGVGKAPELATIERFEEHGYETVPKMDIYAQLLPGGPDAIIAILREYATMSFAELAQPAIDRALEGFPVHHVMQYNLDLSLVERLGFSYLLPYNAAVYLDNKPWKPIHLKERFRRPDLAKTLTYLVDAETQAIADGKSRNEALLAVRQAFYEGDIADAIDAYHRGNDGLIRKSDLSNYSGEWEVPQTGRFGDYKIVTNGPWSQGMTLSMALNILNNVDLKSMGHNSGQYIHTVTQAIELAMSDREAYFGDTNFVDVPTEFLLSNDYGLERVKLLTNAPFTNFPHPAAIYGYEPYISAYSTKGPRDTKTVGDDTSQIIVADSSGNLIAITPSDFPMTPMIPGYDITLGNRMNQFRLIENHPASLQPGKRPRVTPQAVMIRKEGDFYMAINTPGGDNQIQAMLQVLLNHIVWGDDIQQAIERPRFMTLGFPGSFAPHVYKPATLEIEENLASSSINELETLGYTIHIKERWGIAAGVGTIIKSEDNYLIGSDPRAETVAMGE